MKLFAFWKYNLFPYCLGGEVTEFKDGYVFVRGYEGMRFKPTYITDLEHGKNIYEQILDIAGEYQVKKDELREEYSGKVLDLLKKI